MELHPLHLTVNDRINHVETVAVEQNPWENEGFVNMTLGDRAIFELFLSRTHPRISDASFANIFMWSSVYETRWKLIEDCLCIVATQGEEPTMILPPLGFDNFPAAIEQCIETFQKLKVPRFFIEFTNNSSEKLENFQSIPRSGDYLYETQKMIDLTGSKLASKRQSRNAFVKKYRNIRTETFTPNHAQDCIKLLETWQPQVQHSVAIDLKRSQEVVATKNAIQNAAALGLTGMVLYAEDQIVGFTFGEKLDDSTCSILIEKTNREFTGSAQYIFSEFCRQYCADTQWCNVGDDWEIPSLAWTKQSYHPAFRLPKSSAFISL
jgi:hypothetical protein